VKFGSLKVYEEDVEPFSYKEYLQKWGDDSSLVATDGFNNTDIAPIESIDDVIELAKEEISFDKTEYDSIKLYYDTEMNVYKAVFSRENWLGGLDVYINGQGQTIRIMIEE